MLIFFSPENWKIHLKMCKSSILKKILSLFIPLYIVRIGSGSGSGENFPDPTGSTSATLPKRDSMLNFVPVE